MKYEQELNEDDISSGQRQLLSFARALAAEPKILVLDEATSNVDLETERQIQKGIKEMTRGRTSIIIAHRLSTVADCDRIYRLDLGEIIEHGAPETILGRQSR